MLVCVFLADDRPWALRPGASLLFIGMEQDFIQMAVESALGRLRDGEDQEYIKMLQSASRSLDRLNSGKGNDFDDAVMQVMYGKMYGYGP